MSLLPVPKFKQLRTWIPKLHMPLTNLVYLLLVLSGGLGLRLSSQANPIVLAYVAVTLLVSVFTTFIMMCVRRRGSAYARATTRRRLGEEDERDFGMAKWGARKKLESTTSTASTGSEGSWRPGHERSASASSWREAVGGGTMPGPQYLMAMHPGVPVYVK